VNIDEDIAHRIGRAVAWPFGAKSVVIGFDARETSPAFRAWLLDVHCSNTEPLVRLNLEFKGNVGKLEARLSAIADLFGGIGT
jgi:phosphomannomutase